MPWFPNLPPTYSPPPVLTPHTESQIWNYFKGNCWKPWRCLPVTKREDTLSCLVSQDDIMPAVTKLFRYKLPAQSGTWTTSEHLLCASPQGQMLEGGGPVPPLRTCQVISLSMPGLALESTPNHIVQNTWAVIVIPPAPPLPAL